MRRAYKSIVVSALFISIITKLFANNRDTTFIGLNPSEPQYNFSASHSIPAVFSGNLEISPWIFLSIYLLTIGLYLVFKSKYKFSIGYLFKLAISPKFLKVPYDELSNQLRFPLNLLFFAALFINSAFIYASTKIFNLPALDLTLSFFAISLIIWALGYLYSLGIFLIYGNKDLGMKLLLMFKIYFVLVAFILFFLLFLINYVAKPLLHPVLFLGFLIFIIFYISKIISQLYVFKFENFSLLHFILYICSVEIIPVLIALSVLKQ